MPTHRSTRYNRPHREGLVDRFDSPGESRPPIERCPRLAKYFKAGVTAGSWLYEVSVDGIRHRDCVEANSIEGWAIVRVERDPSRLKEDGEEHLRVAGSVYAEGIVDTATRRLTGKVLIRRENG